VLGVNNMRGTPALFFNSLNRPFLVAGVERQLFFLMVGLSLPIAFIGRLAPSTDLIAFILFVVLHVIGVLVTRIDYQILPLYRRHIYYKNYYSAISGIHANVPLLKPSVPVYQGQRGLI